jgi:hypothetical protein
MSSARQYIELNADSLIQKPIPQSANAGMLKLLVSTLSGHGYRVEVGIRMVPYIDQLVLIGSGPHL